MRSPHRARLAVSQLACCALVATPRVVRGGPLDSVTLNGATWESPPPQVPLQTFYIMRTEVTIAHYDRFVEATGARRPESRRPAGPGGGRRDESATGIPRSAERRGPHQPG